MHHNAPPSPHHLVVILTDACMRSFCSLRQCLGQPFPRATREALRDSQASPAAPQPAMEELQQQQQQLMAMMTTQQQRRSARPSTNQ